ncbi:MULTISPECIES: REP-associated tyrosine transposase [Citrobacter]|uniref:REP-associated tyrosine transposase n=1 Tax=Citrobacter TaxID=544 RepID=UPI001A2CE764|nr:transposase [Citrobacter freundii complex sp. 2023EL-00966]MDT3751262.1 transposase [Citrobacter freundii complex sp. 2023EL-00966]
MSNYRRHRVPGGTWFFTVNLWDRQSHLLIDRIDLLREVVQRVRRQHGFHIDAWVILPEHMHCIWTLPEGDDDYSSRWKTIKAAFSQQIPHQEWRSPARQRKGERGIWQRRFWEHTIRDDEDYARHRDYVYINPLKHGLVGRVVDWPYSSFHRDVRQGLYPPDWGGDVFDMEAGERSRTLNKA